MTLCDFKLLDFPLQAHTICQKGIYLSERADHDLFVALYRVCDFYVEIYCCFHRKEIVKFIGFDSDILLEPYLKKVCIDNLFRQNKVLV